MVDRRITTYDVLILTSLIWFLGKFIRYAFPPLFEPLQSSYQVSNATIGLAFTAFMICYAVMQFPSGVLADWLGSVTVIVTGIAVTGIAALVLVVDSPFVVLVVVMVVLGAGTGVHKTVAVGLLSRVYPERTGRAIGVLDTIGALGGVAAPAVIVVFLTAPAGFASVLAILPGEPWRGFFLFAGIAALVLAAVFWQHVTRRPETDRQSTVTTSESTPGVREYLQLFRSIRFSAFVLMTIGVAFAYNGAVAFLPLYLSTTAGLTTTTASLLYSMLFAVTFIQLVTGDLSDRIGRFPVIGSFVGLGAIGLIGLVVFVGASTPILAFLVVVLGIGIHGYRPVRAAYLVEILPDRISGGGLGVVRTLLMIAGAIAPAVVGILADFEGFRFAFGTLAISMTLAGVIAIALWSGERQ